MKVCLTNNQPDNQLATSLLYIEEELAMTEVCHIRPPKPRMSGLDFIPDANCKIFTSLLGLEVVVQMRSTETQHKSPKQSGLMKEKPPPFHSDPKNCDQCSTNVTCQWFRVKDQESQSEGPKHLCKQCKTTSDKKTIYQAHASKMENTFGRVKQKKLEAYWCNQSAVQSQDLGPTSSSFGNTECGLHKCA